MSPQVAGLRTTASAPRSASGPRKTTGRRTPPRGGGVLQHPLLSSAPRRSSRGSAARELERHRTTDSVSGGVGTEGEHLRAGDDIVAPAATGTGARAIVSVAGTASTGVEPAATAATAGAVTEAHLMVAASAATAGTSEGSSTSGADAPGTTGTAAVATGGTVHRAGAAVAAGTGIRTRAHGLVATTAATGEGPRSPLLLVESQMPEEPPPAPPLPSEPCDPAQPRELFAPVQK